jgi:ATP-dependent DNA helicase DinG
MRGELVALDLETTGLDPSQDSVIEVGAVRMLDGEITAEFSTLVDPGILIPPHITHITGIRSQDVAGAPRIDAVLPRIAEFVGNRPVIAHNTSIDMGFLRGKHKILLNNLPIDTYELASVLLPRAPRYNLHSLTSDFDIQLDNAHRALDDARATALLYWRLWHKILMLPYETVREIVNAAQGLNWETTHVLEVALQTMLPNQNVQPPAMIFAPLQNPRPPLKPSENGQPVDVAEVDRILGDGGVLSRHLPYYEHRPQQVQMAEAITEAFNHHQHLLVEAGTGTGKSLAYLIPALLWSMKNRQHVVISTNTINLQEQLIYKDIPALESALGVDVDAVVLKGRGNYLCPRRLTTIRRRRPTSLAELRTLAKILVWLLESDTGDKGEISLRGPVEHVVWQRLSAEDENCTLNRCQAAMSGACPFYKARKAAEAAHILVVNHALLISDAVSGNNVLPDYRYLVVDEAHQLEEAVTNGLTFHIDQTALLRRIADLGGPNRGLLGEILLNTRGLVPEKDLNRLEVFIQMIDEATTLMRAHVEAYFAQIQGFLKDVHNFRAAEYTTFVRIVQQHRGRSSFAQVQAAWGTLSEYFEVIGEAMQRLTKAFGKLREYDIPGYEDFVSSTDTAAQYLQQVRTELQAFSLEPDANKIYWLSMGSNPGEMPTINSAPLHIGPLVENHLWTSKDSVVLTSATLRTNDSFSYIGERLYADQLPTLEVGSPFNYRESTLLYIPNDIPEPTDKHGYQRAVERGLIELAAALNGRVLALFTSYSQLRQTAQAIAPRLALGGITVYDQSDGSSRQALVDGFKSAEKAVLLGTRSFWEGVDIPGESLSALVITRLPFTVPTDPIFAARSETYNDPFNDYAVPDAILRFRQGFGRLIRTTSDRGVVTVFDSRVVHKSYGASFLESLPECTVHYGSLDGLAGAASEWLK